MIVKIKRNHSFTYCARIYVEGKRVSKTFKRKADAESWEHQILAARVSGTANNLINKKSERSEAPTLSEFTERWLREKVEARLSSSTQASYRSDVKRHILPLFGSLRLDEIDVSHANQLIVKLKDLGLSPKSINGTLAVFKGILFDAVRWRVMVSNPLHSAAPLRSNPSTDVYWTDGEIDQFLSENRADPLYPVYVFALNTGMRRGEICALKWDRVSFTRGQIEITRTSGRFGFRETTKTGKKRVIPMNSVVRNLLSQLRKDQVSDFVFSRRKGEPVDAVHLYRDFRAAQVKAKLTNLIRFHDLRHTFASHFMMKGGNIYDLQKILGHSSLEMTQRYAHLSPTHLQSAVQIIAFGGDRQQIVNVETEEGKTSSNSAI